MRQFKDTRGRSWYDLVPDSKWQMDVTINYPGTIRGFHFHKKKREWMFAVTGHYKFVLTNPDEIVYLSEGELIYIEPGRWHGYQNISAGEGIMIEYADQKHDLKNPDDERKPFDAFDSWEKERK